MYERTGKRILDIGIVVASLPITSVLSAVTAVCIILEDGSPVLHKQIRVGAGGKPFRLLKFRSMPIDSAVVPSHWAGPLMVTRVGRIIRRLNVDELPQLINVIRGDMSIVGPRPALADQTELLRLRNESGASRLRPGMTGLAQLNSYEQMPPEEKAHWDEVYAGNLSIKTDVEIVFSTWRYFLKPPPRY